MLVNRIIKNKFVKDILSLASGSVIAQIIALLCTPFLTRYYTPEDFGVLGGVLTVSGIISVIISLKYEMAIVLSKNDLELKSLVNLSFLVLCCFVLFIFPFFYFSPDFLEWLGLANTSPLVITLMCLITIAVGIQNIFYQWHNKLENYILLSKHRVLQSILTIIIQFLCVLVLVNSLGLIWGYVLGILLSISVLIIPLWKELVFLRVKKQKLIKVARKYYRFPFYTTPQNLLNTVSQGLPVLMLGKYFTAEQVGLYFFTVRILQLPSSIIGKSIRQVFYKRASDLRDNIPQLTNEFIKTTKVLMGIIIVPLLIILFFGPQIFKIIFGEKWEVAGEYARWMFLWVSVAFLNPPSNVLFYIFDKQKILFIYEILLFITRFFVLYFAATSGDIMLTIKMYSLVGLIFNAVMILLGLSMIKKII